ncbi:recombinase family protein [Carboxylicivirga marina]|uniref:Recombinase family protein n=1 Tax=Carboxylicivirga marina TaxID=2800988 RepID=A0ABS1HMU5_9BACT|nr:recombinase family protein [Carboxylicivirga marina]MBK3518915.1 recombinase family protein [Carboxylicivirga marina]
MNAVIYSRVSTSVQDYECQIDECTKYASGKGYNLTGIFAEKISGTTKANTRPEFKKMLDHIETNKTNVVLVWELSRLGRKVADVLSHVEELFAKGINVHVLQGNRDTINEKGEKTHFAIMELPMLSALAEMEAAQTKARVKSALKHRRDKGAGQGIPPLGFKNENKVLVRNDDEVKLVKEIFDYCLKGYGSGTIATLLNNDRRPTVKVMRGLKHTTKRWKQAVVLEILKNPIYKGQRRLSIKQVDERLGPLNYAPIIAPDVWEKVQLQIAKNRAGLRKRKNVNIVEGIIKCGCGKAMTMRRKVKTANGKDYLTDNYYLCLSKKEKPSCNHRSVNIDTLNCLVYYHLIDMQRNFDVDAAKVKLVELKMDLEKAKAHLERLWRDEEEALNRLKILFKIQDIDLQEYTSDKEKIKQNINKAQGDRYRKLSAVRKLEKLIKSYQPSQAIAGQISREEAASILPTEANKLREHTNEHLSEVRVTTLPLGDVPSEITQRYTDKTIYYNLIKIFEVDGNNRVYILPSRVKEAFNEDGKRVPLDMVIDIADKVIKPDL